MLDLRNYRDIQLILWLHVYLDLGCCMDVSFFCPKAKFSGHSCKEHDGTEPAFLLFFSPFLLLYDQLFVVFQ